MKRRTLLAALAAGVPAAAAGCVGGPGAAGGPTDTPTDTPPVEAVGTSEKGGGPDIVDGVPDDADHVVDMNDQFDYVPDELTISAGDTVAWKNVGEIGHSVTAYEDEIPADADYFASGGLDSEESAREAYPSKGFIAGGQAYVHAFETTGSYEYFCIPHENIGMIGTITVE